MPFNGLAPYTLAKNRPVTPPTAWVRPSDWIAITDDTNKIQFLVCDSPNATLSLQTAFTRVSGSQDILIDWGDGTTTTVSTTSSTYTDHTYSSGGTPSTQGYNTWKITVTLTGTGSTTVQTCNIRQAQSLNGVTPVNSTGTGLLEAYYGDTIASALQSFYLTGANGLFPLFAYCKLPATMSYTTLTNAFSGCSGLYTVVMPTSAANVTDISSAFLNCYNLQSITLPSNMTGLTTMASAFSGCSNLQSVTLPPTLNSVTTIASAFLNCVLLGSITMPSLNSCTTWTSAFQGCVSLLWCKITSFATSGTINLTTTWSGCTAMQWCWWPATVTAGLAWTWTNTFNTCTALQAFTLPENWNGTTLNFAGCTSLTTFTFPTTSMSNLTSLSFSGCSNLQEITLPTTVGSPIVPIFTNCTSLSTITIPSGWTLGSISSMFSGCTSLVSAYLPNNTQNSITTGASCFSGCTKLETVVLPTVWTNTTCNSFFANCTNLRSVTLPDWGTTNNITFTSFASGCTNLRSVTFLGGMGGTSSLGCTSMFQNCSSLKSVTFPTSYAGVSYSSAFSGCSSLQSVTLPTTQSTTTTTCTSMFANCPNLTTINNIATALGSQLTSGALVTASTFMTGGTAQITSLSFPQRFAKLELQGTATNRSRLSSLRLTNTGGSQWTGASPQISVAYTDMSTANLVTLFNDLAAQGSVTSKTIDITSATGAAGLTLANRQIITNIGWTITG